MPNSPRHSKTYIWAYADSEGLDQPANPQSDQGVPCPLTESLDTTECMNGEQRPGRYIEHAQDDLNLHNTYVREGTFSFDATKVASGRNHDVYYYLGRVKQKKCLSNMRKMRRFIFCACSKYHPGLCSPYLYSEVANDFISVSGQ